MREEEGEADGHEEVADEELKRENKRRKIELERNRLGREEEVREAKEKREVELEAKRLEGKREDKRTEAERETRKRKA